MLRKTALAVSLLSFMFIVASCHSASKDSAQAAGASDSKPSDTESTDADQKLVTIPAGTEIQVRLVDSLSSAGSRAGEEFLATLDQPIVQNNWVVVPRGVSVRGRVTDAQASGHLQTPARLDVTLTSFQVGEKTYDIRTSSYYRRAQSHRKRNLEWIGGSAAGGALLGALVGRGKGAAIGAAAGAGGGTAAAYATGRKDIVLPSETRLRFVLKEPVSVERAG